MNAKGRKELAAIVAELRAVEDTLANLLERAETLAEEEQEKVDNMPDGLRESERGERMTTQADALASLVAAIEGAGENLQMAFDAAEEIDNA